MAEEEEEEVEEEAVEVSQTLIISHKRIKKFLKFIPWRIFLLSVQTKIDYATANFLQVIVACQYRMHPFKLVNAIAHIK